MKHLLVVVLLALAAGATTQAQDRSVSYDEFGQMDDQQKLRVFNEVPPENKALLVRTQAERWLTVNRARLSAEQVEAVEEAIAFIRPELYGEANREEAEVAGATLMRRMTEVLTREDMMQAFTRHGAYIPPPVE